MYTDLKSVQILIGLLKEFHINHIVIAPGTRALPLVHSIEQDSFFECFSIVDERSAGFFALGLIQKIKKPVAVCCTSGTAGLNILSATNEAKYQRLPLLVLTAERLLYFLDQYPDQMAPTHEMYNNICKSSVVLPQINNSTDEWRCEISINQALSELENKIPGPVNILFQVKEKDVFSYNTAELPDIKRIERISIESVEEIWLKKVDKLQNARNILFVCGQHSPFSENEENIIEKFSKKYNCLFLIDNISNFHLRKNINPAKILKLAAVDSLRKLVPDILISFGGHSVNNIKSIISLSKNTEHWLINGNGEFVDCYNKLTTVFECSESYFFNYFSEVDFTTKNNEQYFDLWKQLDNKLCSPKVGYSDIYAIEKVIEHIPEESLLHIGNSISIRYSQFFKTPDSVEVCCNRGSSGIDGCLSTYVGASVKEDNLCFMLIGDLSFFYDMTGLWNKYLKKNIRIMVNNNSGGMIFNSNVYWAPYEGVNNFTAAEHDAVAKGWCESRGFKYISAKNIEEFEQALPQFFDIESIQPILFEVFTDKRNNDEIFVEYIKKEREVTAERVANYVLKKMKLT